QHQAGAGDQIAGISGSIAQEAERRGDHRGNRRALPDEVDQRPAGGLQQRRHRAPPLLLAISFLISSSSSGVVFVAASAWSTSFAADPSKTRSSRSVTSCRSV